MSFYRFLMGALAVASLVACGSVEKEKKKRSGAIDSLELTGRWDTSCVEKGFFTTSYQREQYEFSPLNNFEKQVIQHNDKRCKDEVFRISLAGSYETAGNAENETDAKNINFTIKTVEATAFTNEMADALNAKEYCGIKDWVADKPQRVEGQDCEGDSFKRGDVILDIYKIEGDELLLGRALVLLDSLGIQQRPSDLNDDRVYKKQ
jgi:hypothetical protein